MRKNLTSTLPALLASAFIFSGSASAQNDEDDLGNALKRIGLGILGAGLGAKAKTPAQAGFVNGIVNAGNGYIEQDEAMKRARAGASNTNVNVNVGSGGAGTPNIQESWQKHEGEGSFPFLDYTDFNHNGVAEEEEFTKKYSFEPGRLVHFAAAWKGRKGELVECQVLDPDRTIVHKYQYKLINNGEGTFNKFILPSDVSFSGRKRFLVEYFVDGRPAIWQNYTFEVDYSGPNAQAFVVNWEDTNNSGKPDKGDKMEVVHRDNPSVQIGKFFILTAATRLDGQKVEYALLRTSDFDKIMEQRDTNVSGPILSGEFNYSGTTAVWIHNLDQTIKTGDYTSTMMIFPKDTSKSPSLSSLKFRVVENSVNTRDSSAESLLEEVIKGAK